MNSKSDTRCGFSRLLLAALAMLTIAYLLLPLGRIGLRCELNYNEGWNLYQAQRLLDQLPLYPSKTGWTLNNYPAFSFLISSALHPLTHDLLYTARVLNLLALLATAILLGGIGLRLGFSRQASVLTALFALAVFATSACNYVGVYDPQMLAQSFLVAAIFIYLGDRTSPRNLACALLCFLIGLFIKHNQIDLPLAVLVDLFLISRRRALCTAAAAVSGAAIIVLLHAHLWGSAFVSLLLGGRLYSRNQMMTTSLGYGMLLAFPLLVAAHAAWQQGRNRNLRLLVLLLIFSAPFCVYFSGGIGVNVNALFSLFIAMILLNGAFFDRLLRRHPAAECTAAATIAALFLWLLIPASFAWQGLNPFAELVRFHQRQDAFAAEVDFLHQHAGDAICESMLACALGGKAFVVDPFNATRQFETGALAQQPLLQAIDAHRFGVIEMVHLHGEAEMSHRFTPQMLAAIRHHYRIAKIAGDRMICLPAVGGQESAPACEQ